MPARKLRWQVLETIEYYDPKKKTIMEMTVPREEVFLVGLERY